MPIQRTSPPPDLWPYQARTPLPPWVTREDLDFAGFGAGWTHWGPGDLAMEEAPSLLGQAFGRGGVARAGSVVVRPFRRGGLVRHLNERTYLSAARFRSEAEMHRALWEAGLPTVEPLGCAWRRRGVGWEGLYLTRWTEARPWPHSFQEEAFPQVEALIDALSGWGVWIPDLNATNLLVQPNGTVLALDFDRAQFQHKALKEAYWGRLLRSLRKLHAPRKLIERVELRS